MVDGEQQLPCSVCETVTEQLVGRTLPGRRGLLRRGNPEVIDLVTRHWARCRRCGFQFALPGPSAPPP